LVYESVEGVDDVSGVSSTPRDFVKPHLSDQPILNVLEEFLSLGTF
jgi:hypothetical protein